MMSMIEVANTENLGGVAISGDLYDLEQLVDALHKITINDGEELDKQSRRFINISDRVLGLCYDIRHAAQGDREFLMKENGIHEHHQAEQKGILPRQNIYFSCNYLYPEMIIIMIALNELIRLRTAKLVKSKYRYDAAYDKRVIWDETIAVIRSFQAAFQKALSEVLSPAAHSRWLNMVTNPYIDIARITSPFIDLHNIQYIEMTREQRAKKLLTITKRLCEYQNDPENWAYRRAIDAAVLEHGWPESDIHFEGLDYPEDFAW